MPPRYTYWTIIVGGQPTAFRAATQDELLPTLKQLQSKQPDAVMMWFARGKLWPTEEASAFALRQEREGGGGERRSNAWRPGGEHKDPRDKFKVPREHATSGSTRSAGRNVLPATGLSDQERTGREEIGLLLREKIVQGETPPSVRARIDPVVIGQFVLVTIGPAAIVRSVHVKAGQVGIGRSALARIAQAVTGRSALAKTGMVATHRFVHARTAVPIGPPVIGHSVHETTAAAIARKRPRGRSPAETFAEVLASQDPAASPEEGTPEVVAASTAAVSRLVEIAAVSRRVESAAVSRPVEIAAAATGAAAGAGHDDRPRCS